MASDYEKLFTHFKSIRKDLLISRIEASDNDDISLRYGVFSFPRVVLFFPGDLQIKAVFDGKPRSLHFFTEWIDSNLPAIQTKTETANKNKKFISEEHLEKKEIHSVLTLKNAKIGKIVKL